jgi:hypothetical protein
VGPPQATEPGSGAVPRSSWMPRLRALVDAGDDHAHASGHRGDRQERRVRDRQLTEATAIAQKLAREFPDNHKLANFLKTAPVS